MSFVNLHSHSYFSLLDGYSSPEELFARAAELEMPALAITDHGSLSAHRPAVDAAAASGVKPILGVEAYVTYDRYDKRSAKSRAPEDQIYNHLIVLAKNKTGLDNLNKLSEDAWTEGFYVKPRMDFETLEKYSEGLLIGSGCMNGMIAKDLQNKKPSSARATLDWFKSVFGDDFYMEIQPHNPEWLNHALLELADETNTKSVVTLDCHYASEADAIAEEFLLILGTHPNPQSDFNFEESLKRKDMMERLDYIYGERKMSFAQLRIGLESRMDVRARLERQGIVREDIFENTLEAAGKVEDYSLPKNVDLLPVQYENPNSELRSRSFAGLRRRGIDTPEYRERLEEELQVISDKNFSPYFMIVGNMIQWAKKNGIMVGPGRGSAAGSLVCYALGITEIDPIEYGLLFFRFLNPERSGWPDIDVDFEDARRDEVKRYLERQYRNVGSIATFSRFSGKGLVRDVSRALRIPLRRGFSGFEACGYLGGFHRF